VNYQRPTNQPSGTFCLTIQVHRHFAKTQLHFPKAGPGYFTEVAYAPDQFNRGFEIVMIIHHFAGTRSFVTSYLCKLKRFNITIYSFDGIISMPLTVNIPLISALSNTTTNFL
jgi:hypothetical protein